MTEEDIERIATLAAEKTVQFMTAGGDSEAVHGPQGNAYRNMYNVCHWAYDQAVANGEALKRIEGRMG